MKVPKVNLSERRAILARLSFCLLGIMLVSALLAQVASAAELTPPSLRETNPASPGASLTLRIRGQEEEAQTKAVIPQARLLAIGVVARGLEPTNTVKIRTDAECKGPVVAEDSITTFYATQGNGTETSSCSEGLTYRQVSSPPDPPVFTSVIPASPANNNFPRLIGTTDPDATISLYTNQTCTGTRVASGSAKEFESFGIEVFVENNFETTFYAKANLAGYSSPCSLDSIVYREVTPAPGQEGGGSGSGGGGTGGNGGGSVGGGAIAPSSPISRPTPPAAPQLKTVPGGIGNDVTPVLTGSAPGASSVFVYASANCTGQPVARGSADQFSSSGFEVQVAPNATAVFSAVAGVTGAQSVCSASVSYVEDSLAPKTRITMGPAAKTAKRKAVFRFTEAGAAAGPVPGTAFFCRVNKAKWTPCSSPFSLRHLKPRSYLVRVRAVDEAGNLEASGAARRFRVIASK